MQLKPVLSEHKIKKITTDDYNDWGIVLIDNTIRFIEYSMIGEDLQLIDILLIDTNAQLNINDYPYHHHYIGQQGFNKITDIVESKNKKVYVESNENSLVWSFNELSKILASSNKSHKMPHLSFDAISELMAIYNDFGRMPEYVFVEMIDTPSKIFNEFDNVPYSSIKLNNGVVDIKLNRSQKYNNDDLLNQAILFCEDKDKKFGEHWSNDYRELPKAMVDFAKSDVVENYWIQRDKKNVNKDKTLKGAAKQMCKPQLVQLDCRETDCVFHENGSCIYPSPAITLINGSFNCWNKQREI